MKTLLIIFTVCFSVLTSGCKLEYKDVSDLPEYKSLLNSSFSLKTEMYISGINLPPGYGKEINIYSINPNRNWDGPELITRDPLKTGTILKIQSLRRCNTLWVRTVQAVVVVDLFKKIVNVPIVIDLEYINSTDLMTRLN